MEYLERGARRVKDSFERAGWLGEGLQNASEATGTVNLGRRRRGGRDQAEVPERRGGDVVTELGDGHHAREGEQGQVVVDDDHG